MPSRGHNSYSTAGKLTPLTWVYLQNGGQKWLWFLTPSHSIRMQYIIGQTLSIQLPRTRGKSTLRLNRLLRAHSRCSPGSRSGLTSLSSPILGTVICPTEQREATQRRLAAPWVQPSLLILIPLPCASHRLVARGLSGQSARR